MMLYTFLLFVGVVLGVAAQLSLKTGVARIGVRRLRRLSLREFFDRVVCNKPIIFGFIFYGVSVLLWLVVISELELSYAYPMVASGYFFVALFSKFLFHEKVSRTRWLGIAIIIFGVILVGLS